MSNMDKLDKQLLHELSYNSRQPLTKLAKTLNTSKQVIQYRINNLNLNTIPIIDNSALGYTTYLVFLQTNKNININQKEITWAARTTGNFDLVLAIATETNKQFHRIFSKITKHTKKHHFIISIEEHPMHLKYLWNKRHPIKTIGNEQPTILTTNDIKILKALEKNARSSLVQISKTTNLTINKIQTRLKHLEQSIIKGYTINYNINNLNMHEYELLINTDDNPKLISYLKEHPNITFIVKCIGKWDLLLKIDAKNNQHFDTILQDIKQNFPEIRSYQTLLILDNLKFSFLPF